MAYEPHAYWPQRVTENDLSPAQQKAAVEFFFSHLPLHPERGAFVDQTLTPAELALYRQPPRLRKDGVPWLDAARAAERCQLWQRAVARCDLNDGEAIRLEDVRGQAYLQK